MARRSKRKTRLIKAELTLTPMIDTALTLLIIFMITAPIMNNSIKVTLPDGSAKEAADIKQDLIVYINAQGKVFFNKKEFSLDNLIVEVKKAVGKNKEQTVFVKADKIVEYGQVIKVVDKIKVVGGVDYVALATQSPART